MKPWSFRRRLLLLAFTAALLPLPAFAADTSATRRLHALFDAHWQWAMRTYPEWATFVGDHRYGDRLHDASPAVIAAEYARLRLALALARGAGAGAGAGDSSRQAVGCGCHLGALYAEKLGFELALYKDPYSRFGHLQDQALRAARLVVDTGLHALGWSRERAIDFMAERTGKQLPFVSSEVDRYLSWPAQALAYMIGEMNCRTARPR